MLCKHGIIATLIHHTNEETEAKGSEVICPCHTLVMAEPRPQTWSIRLQSLELETSLPKVMSWLVSDGAKIPIKTKMRDHAFASKLVEMKEMMISNVSEGE